MSATARAVDLGALYVALDARRAVGGESWRDLAASAGVSASTMTRLKQGRQISLDGYVRLVDWLGYSADAFIRGPQRSEAEAQEVVDRIREYLERDRATAADLLALLPSLTQPNSEPGGGGDHA